MHIVPRLGSGIPLVARTSEMRRLRAALARAERNEAGAVLLSGDAGVGKTRVLTELGEHAAGRGALVLTGRCLDVREGGLPYLPFAEALTPLATSGDSAVADALRVRQALGRLLPQLGTVLPPSAEHTPVSASDHETRGQVRPERDLGQLQLFDAVLGLLTELSERTPVVLLLEDLHWADGSTRNLFSFLLSRLRAQRLLVVASYREEDVHRRHPLRPVLSELVRLASVERIELPPFGEADARQFVTALAEATLSPEVISGVIERSQGNPFFLEELIASCADEADLPIGLAEVLLSRVERLSAETRRVLRLISVANGGVSHAVLNDLSGLDELALDEALREAVQHHVLVVDKKFYLFRHALLREAVYGDLLPGERTRTHAQYADRLRRNPESRGGDALLAYHSLESNDLPTALAASKRAAAEADGLGAPASALKHIEQALAIWDAVPESERPEGVDEIKLLTEASYFAGTSGEPERAIAYARSAVEAIHDGVPAERAAMLWRRLAQVLAVLDGSWDESVEAIARAWELVEHLPASRTRAWVLSTRAIIQRGEDKIADALWSAQSAVADARAVGADGAEADALVTLGALAETEGHIEEARDRLRQAQRKAAQAGALNVQLRARYFLASSYEELSEIDKALAAYRESSDYAKENGLTWSSFGLEARARHLYLRYVSGDWPTEDGRPHRGVSSAVAARMTASWVYIVAARGRLAEAEKMVESLRSEWRTDILIAIAGGAVGIDIAYWRGDHNEAVRRTEEVIRELEEFEPWLLGGVRMVVLGMRSCSALAAAARVRGDAEAEAAAVAKGEELLTHGRSCLEHGKPRSGTMGPEGRAWQARLAAETPELYGRFDPAAWAEVVAEFGYGAVYEQAMARQRYAAALLSTGEAADAELAAAELLKAYEVSERLGAKPLGDSIRDLAHRARIELPGQAPRRDVVDPLTERERAVLERVALGRTNRQVGEELYISEKTVSVHLSRVMAKLGASRRAEAVAIAKDRGLLSA
ncbi:helix-turn-helix transcriptional regulator [Amycolatopsis sp. YIM 10]|uniref:helix-turn-helix transcriptional regulator n=1 Tax=Amycolatopsis sp. YIM 10 TaxID=2653857 RepID=UPI00129029C3|nr:helix-turn-helix transcriptional regulator [Amycolatopsis sp. YIM 10]QFU88030.1 Transcriptional regulatory protein LiaR [Amycolatopsis sp. YIM 10]